MDCKMKNEELIDLIFRELLVKYGFKIRENQISLSKKYLDALRHIKILISEAEVGIGKTFAYLIACIVNDITNSSWQEHTLYEQRKDFSMDTKMPIIISTSSKELQKAIIRDYIPKISAILVENKIIDFPLKSTLRKGKGNYVCHKRLANQIKIFEDAKSTKDEEYIILKNLSKRDYDLEKIENLSEKTKRKICVQGCNLRNCKYSGKCGYSRYYRFSKQYIFDFQICNHNYFFADLKKRIENKTPLLPNYRGVILDEAHKLEFPITQIFQENYKIISKYLWDKGIPIVLTSRTLSTNSNFDFLMRKYNIRHSNRIDTTIVKSPFDYEKNCILYISEKTELPYNDNDDYINSISDEIQRLVYATKGRTLILFTSYNGMTKAYSQLSEKEIKYPMLIAKQNDKSVLDRFKKCKNGILFATGAMWEGIDLAGDILSSVIVARLPFPIQEDEKEIRFYMKDIGQYAEKKIHYFNKHLDKVVIPQMIIKLKQGFGRLIRHEDDRGVFAILDCRASSKGRYRKNVLDSLPKCKQVDSINDITTFFQ